MRERKGESVGEVSHSVPVSVPNVISPLDNVCDLVSLSVSPPLELDEEAPRRWQIARVRPLIETMGSYLKKSEQCHVGIDELEHFLLSPGDDTINILSFAENACGEGGRKKFGVVETKGGTAVAEVRRFFEALQANQDRNFREMQEAVEYMQDRRSRLLETMERKQKLMSGAREEIRKRIHQDVMALEDLGGGKRAIRGKQRNEEAHGGKEGGSGRG